MTSSPGQLGPGQLGPGQLGPGQLGPVRMGVVGCASIARRRFLPALRAVPELALVAVASRDPQRARQLAAGTGAEPVHGYQRLLCRDDVDAVYLPVPAGLHHHWAVAALRAGKHVLVEKPATPTAARTAELVDLARAAGLVLAENFVFLHHPQHRRVAELLAAGEIGELREVAASFGIPPLPAADIRYRPELAGGCLLDVGAYPIRVAQWLLGEQVVVRGATGRIDDRTGVDVAGSALLASPDGVTARLAYGLTHHYRNTYTLWGSAGTITVDWAFSPPDHHRATVEVARPDRTVVHRLPAENQFARAAAWFARSVTATRTPAPDVAGGADARQRPSYRDSYRDPVAAATPESTVQTARLVDAVRAAAGLPEPETAEPAPAASYPIRPTREPVRP